MTPRLLAGVAALSLLMAGTAFAADKNEDQLPEMSTNEPQQKAAPAPRPSGPPPLGTVFTQYTVCMEPRTCPIVFVSVDAAALNVRGQHGEIVMALVNGTPLRVLGRNGAWTLVAPACDLIPTWAVVWDTGVPVYRCWVYW